MSAVTDQKTSTEKYLELVASKTKLSIESFVLKYGSLFENKKSLPASKMGKMKFCFMNAFQLAMSEDKYTYVEGFAFDIIYTLHAWCVDKEGNIYDPTWTNGKEYFGVPFKKQFLIEAILSKGSYGIIDNPLQQFPLVRELIDPLTFLANIGEKSSVSNKE